MLRTLYIARLTTQLRRLRPVAASIVAALLLSGCGGGASSNESFEKLMTEGFDFVQLGRTLLADPDLPKQAAAIPSNISRCVHCNDCIGTIESDMGIHCPRFSAR